MVITMFLVLIVGFILGKIKIIDEVSSKGLSKLIIMVAQPALIIGSITSKKYSLDNLKLALIGVGLSLLLHCIMALIARLLCMKIKDFDARKITEFALVFGNTGFLGIPLFDALLPENGGFVASFFIVGFNVLLWIIGLGIIARGREDIKLTPKKIFINKGTIASLIGFIIFLIPAIPAAQNFELPVFISKAINYISGLCTPITMLLAGALIARKNLKSIFSNAKIYYLLALRLVLIPIVFCFIFKIIGFSDFWVIFLTVALGLPSATSTITFAEVYDTSPEYAAQCVGATTLFSIATMPCIVLLTQWICTLNISIFQLF
ncbi:MAG: hypothetical protein E7678_08520 [Ruminococcaceae bacterium]|nr:hypothetical protein [Oscillospiraceae bacterium]